MCRVGGTKYQRNSRSAARTCTRQAISSSFLSTTPSLSRNRSVNLNAPPPVALTCTHRTRSVYCCLRLSRLGGCTSALLLGTTTVLGAITHKRTRQASPWAAQHLVEPHCSKVSALAMRTRVRCCVSALGTLEACVSVTLWQSHYSPAHHVTPLRSSSCRWVC